MVGRTSEKVTEKDLSEEQEIVVKPMEIDDIAPAFHLGEKLFTLSAMPNLYRIWDEYEIIDFYHDSSEYCFSAFADGKFAGFLLGTVIEKKTNRKYGYLVWTGVGKDYGGMGVASMLFEKFKETMIKENVSMIIVDTQADNHNAIEFFKSKGFKNPRDHIYFTLSLKEEGGKKRTAGCQ